MTAVVAADALAAAAVAVAVSVDAGAGVDKTTGADDTIGADNTRLRAGSTGLFWSCAGRAGARARGQVGG